VQIPDSTENVRVGFNGRPSVAPWRPYSFIASGMQSALYPDPKGLGGKFG
jgi:hypothetical protein